MPRTMAQKKGDSLEDAVRAIEETILQTAPGFAEGIFRIYNKRVVVTEGVRHEIDIFVAASLPNGYEATFIFECKNWKAVTGKNEVIIFSEKVAATGAMRGFLVAMSFSKDARAQARKDSRISLLLASHNQPVVHVQFPQFVHVHIGKTDAHVQVGFESRDGAITAEQLVVAGKVFRHGDEARLIEEYMNQWVDQVRHEQVNSQRVGERADGPYAIDLTATRTFNSGEASLDNEPVRRLTLAGRAEVTVIRATVLSIYDVSSRGRLLKIGIDHAGIEIRADVVELAQG
jgi:hypothetical protein